MFGFTPLMEAAASGHEIIVQYLLDHVRVCVCMCTYIFPAKTHLLGSCVASCEYFCARACLCCVGRTSRGEELQRRDGASFSHDVLPHEDRQPHRHALPERKNRSDAQVLTFNVGFIHRASNRILFIMSCDCSYEDHVLDPLFPTTSITP